MEGHLYATTDVRARLSVLDVHIDLRRGDSLNVGYSAKFEPRDFLSQVAAHGMRPDAWWCESRWRYGLFLFTRDGAGNRLPSPHEG